MVAVSLHRFRAATNRCAGLAAIGDSLGGCGFPDGGSRQLGLDGHDSTPDGNRFFRLRE